jgi:hypothetical protein
LNRKEEDRHEPQATPIRRVRSATHSWQRNGRCRADHQRSGRASLRHRQQSGDTKFEAWEEGSALKEYTYKITGGTGKYQDASGGGTYFYENLTDTLSGGTYKGQIVLP